MVAREVEHAAAELRALRREEWGQAAVAAVAFGLALVASRLHPAFAVPLLFGGVTTTFLLMRSMWRRWDLLDRLALDRDAYEIPDVRRRGEKAATATNRHILASSIRCLLSQPAPVIAPRVNLVAEDLEALAAGLDDDDLLLDPASAVACERLLNNLGESPLRNPTLPAEDAHARICQVLTGFQPRRA